MPALPGAPNKKAELEGSAFLKMNALADVGP
jgi:hypothetical protein